MGFGRKKSKAQGEPAAAEAPEPVAAEPPASRKGKKRKPAELLSSVVNESATGAAIDLLKRNDPFALPNGTSWVGLLLSVDQIGGLSQKQKNDATKGSIIELIAADKIQVVATKAMLDEEFLGLIPNPDTLTRMDEYRLLTDAPYYWVVFRTEDNGNTLIADAVQDVAASYATAVAISRGERTLEQVLPHVWSWGSESMGEFDRLLVGATARAASAESGRSAITADPMADAMDNAGGATFDFPDMDDAVIDPLSGVVSEAEPEVQDEPLPFDEAQFEQQFADSADAGDEHDPFENEWDGEIPATPDEPEADEPTADTGYFQYLVENKDRVVDEQEVRDTIARRFLSNDLDLVVDLAEFEAVFGTQPEAIELEIAADATDWLGSQVAQLSRQANAELAALHQGHADELRQLFVETMALHVEKTMGAVSTDTAGAPYANLMESAKRDFDSKRANSAQEVAEQRREIIARFEAAAQSRADQAAAHAKAVYEDKNRPKLERDLAEIALDHDRRVEEQYAHDRQTVLEMRRKEALVRMDVGTNRAFEYLRGIQQEQREAERRLLELWNGRLVQFIDENRKNDVARAAVLAEELARTNQVDTLKAEHQATVAELTARAAAREAELNAELVRTREAGLAELTARRSEWETAIGLEKDRARGNSDLIEQLRGQINDLGAQYEGQYSARIAILEADREAAASELERSHAMQKRTNQMLVLLMLVLTLAGVAVGVIAGWAWGHQQPVEVIPAGAAVLGALLP